jgi:hypothetical protein
MSKYILLDIANSGMSTKLHDKCKTSKDYDSCKKTIANIILSFIGLNKFDLLYDAAKNGEYMIVKLFVNTLAKYPKAGLIISIALKWAILYWYSRTF